MIHITKYVTSYVREYVLSRILNATSDQFAEKDIYFLTEMPMTNLLNSRHNLSHEETLVELEYLSSELFASAEFSLLATVISVWLFLRLYWFGIIFYGRFTGQEID